MTVDEKKIDLAYESGELDPIAAEAYKEMEAEARGVVYEPKKEEPKEEKAEEPKEEIVEEEKAEEENLDEKPAEEPASEEAEPSKEPEEPEAEPTEAEPEEEVIRKVAVNEGLTLEDAKERHTARQNLIAKYKKDPYEMAKALQSTQSAFDKARIENEKLKETSNYDVLGMQIEQEKAKIPQLVQGNADKIISEYRSKYPKKSERLSDEEILEEAQELIRSNYDKKVEEKLGEIKSQAQTRRDELLKEVPEHSKHLTPEIKEILDKTPDTQIAASTYSLEDVVAYVRGQHYTPEKIKKLEEEAYKRGKEEAKIVGSKKPPSSGSGPQNKPNHDGSLTEKQMERARHMFPAINDDKKVAEFFRDIYATELKENRNFVPLS